MKSADKKLFPVVGIDEVGRGPIAGPVSVCSFLIKSEAFYEAIEKLGNPPKDSKKLSAKKREEWFTFLENMKNQNLCDYHVSHVSAVNIDKAGIAKAIIVALTDSLVKLAVPLDTQILLDGSLHAPDVYKNQLTIIKGDETEVAISCASIIAKVTRDKIMKNYDREYPGYGFEQHAGYGTKAHFEAIKAHGVTELHRKSFLTKWENSLSD